VQVNGLTCHSGSLGQAQADPKHPRSLRGGDGGWSGGRSRRASCPAGSPSDPLSVKAGRPGLVGLGLRRDQPRRVKPLGEYVRWRRVLDRHSREPTAPGYLRSDVITAPRAQPCTDDPSHAFGAALAVLTGQVARVVRCSSSCTAYASGYGKSSTGCEALAASGHGARPVTLPPWHGSHNRPSSREQSARARSDGSRPRAAQPRRRASRQGQKSWRLARDTPAPRRCRGVPYTPLSDAANVVTGPLGDAVGFVVARVTTERLVPFVRATHAGDATKVACRGGAA
jgi:hypothetical protein